jgi:hypothetical protein
VAEQVLDAVLQRRRGRRAARAGALHLEIHDAVAVAPKGDVAAVARDRGANPGLEQVLDGLDRFGVGRVEELALALDRGRAAGRDDRRAGHVVFHDRAEDRGLEVLPLARPLRHRDEVAPKEHAGHVRHPEQAGGQRRRARVLGIARLERAVAHDGLAGQELQGRRVRRHFGLDEHGTSPGRHRPDRRPLSTRGRDVDRIEPESNL